MSNPATSRDIACVHCVIAPVAHISSHAVERADFPLVGVTAAALGDALAGRAACGRRGRCAEVELQGAGTTLFRRKDVVSTLVRSINVDRLHACAHDAQEFQELVSQ